MSHVQMHLACHQMDHCLPKAVRLGMIVTLHDHNRQVLRLERYHDHVEKTGQSHQLLERRHDHKALAETFHNLDEAGYTCHPLRHKGLQHNCLVHILADIGSCMQHNMGMNSTDDHKDIGRAVLVVERVELVALEQFDQVAEFDLADLE
jgi:hypothetical protein